MLEATTLDYLEPYLRQRSSKLANRLDLHVDGRKLLSLPPRLLLNLFRRVADWKLPIVDWDHCPDRLSGRDNGPILPFAVRLSLRRRKLIWKLFASTFDSTTRCKYDFGRV